MIISESLNLLKMKDNGEPSKASSRGKPLSLIVPYPSLPDLGRLSRRTVHGFDLIPFEAVEDDNDSKTEGAVSAGVRDITTSYKLPVPGSPKLLLNQRQENRADLRDFDVCNWYNIDKTGLVCPWPSKEVLAYFCFLHADMFRSRKVIELGSGYGLAGLVIAATIEASIVVISDGNPQVVNYIQRNIDANLQLFSRTKVSLMMLHWSQSDISGISNIFDIIVASDCTFFKEFHSDLSRIIKYLLKKRVSSEAILFSPKRGDSPDKFLDIISKSGLSFSVIENYNAEVFKRHRNFLSQNESCLSYEKDHCYPLQVRVKLEETS